MFKNYVNFTARTKRKDFWLAFLFMILAAVVLGVTEGLLGFGNTISIAPGVNVTTSGTITSLYALAIIVPGIAMEIRRLRDAGYPWHSVFLGFIPIVGSIILLVRFCKPSVADDGTPVV